MCSAHAAATAAAKGGRGTQGGSSGAINLNSLEPKSSSGEPWGRGSPARTRRPPSGAPARIAPAQPPMARRPLFKGASPAALVFLAALALVCILALRDNYLVHRSQHELIAHGADVPPWARGRRGGSSGGSGSTARLAGEIWAGFAPPRLVEQRSTLLSLLSAVEKQELESLCGRCLLHQLKLFAPQGNAHKVTAHVHAKPVFA